MKLRKSAGLVLVFAAGVAARSQAQAGIVTGTVRGVGGAPLASRLVGLIGSFGGMSTTTDAAGQYTFSGLDAGTYFLKLNLVFEWPSQIPEPNGVVGELYYEIPCPMNGCSERAGTEIAVPASGTVTIDLDLAPGSRIEGSVTASGGGALPGITVEAFDAKGRLVASTSTDVAGAYTIQSIPAGRYFLHTFSLGARADQLYPGIECSNNQCDPTNGTAVAVGGGATVAGINFVLPPGGSISGTLRDAANSPIVDAVIEVWKGSQRFGFDFQTDATGFYQVDGLATGNNYRVLARKGGFVTAIYNGVSTAAPCPHGGCDIGSTGAGVIVIAGVLTSGKDFQLAAGHSISGSIAGGGHVAVFGGTGLAGEIGAGSTYILTDLPDDSYRVRLTRQRAISENWNNRQCSGAFLCASDSVVMSGANVGGIDFALDAASAIRGRVTDAANGDPVDQILVQSTWSTTATAMAFGTTSADGWYETNSEGLPAGSYRLRTVGPLHAPDYADQIWPNVPCEPSCAPGSGSPVTVSTSADTVGVDFALGHTGVDFFTLTPCRVYDSRSAGGPLLSGVPLALRAETRCGIPGHAVAISANVTVVSPTGDGFVAIWPFNLPSPPPTSVINFRAGATRADNAILGMSLAGFSNMTVLGTVAGNGSYQLIIDVNGYFAPSVSP